MPARDGLLIFAAAAALAALVFAIALRMRSWPLWLIAFAITVVALVVAWSFRDPSRAVAGSVMVASLALA